MSHTTTPGISLAGLHPVFADIFRPLILAPAPASAPPRSVAPPPALATPIDAQ